MAKKAVVPEVPISVFKISTCSTLSGRSELTYHVGKNAESELHFRVVQSSGNGQFNANWVSLTTIKRLLATHPADNPLTSRVLLPVFRSKSANSPAFLLAALKAEGLVKAGTEKDSGYQIGDIEAYKKEMAGLISSDINLSPPAETPEVPKRKSKDAK